MERRIVAQLLACMDGLPCARHEGGAQQPPQPPPPPPPAAGGDAEVTPSPSPRRNTHVSIIGATNRPDALDSALRRAGRFDREVTLSVPDEAGRARILAVQAAGLRLEGHVGGFDFGAIAKLTPGFVGADLLALTQEAAALAVARCFDALDAAASASAASASSAIAVAPAEGGARPPAAAPAAALPSRPIPPASLASLCIRFSDYADAVKTVQPSATREGFASAPSASWADVGALCDVRDALSMAISLPIAHPTRFAALGLTSAAGVLLYGPPGCGKTLVARATASDARANFISIKGPELLSKYVGESERAVRTVFARAAAAAPCVLFFDELDALAPRRGADGGSAAAERVVNALLTEMDGLDPRKGVYVVAATNRPDMVDPAMLRPGRLDVLLYVPLPNEIGRSAILRALTRAGKPPLAPDVDIDAVAAAATRFSGADLSSLLREAAWAALREAYGGGEGGGGEGGGGCAPEGGEQSLRVHARHFVTALTKVAPSVSEEDGRRYERLRDKLAGPPTTNAE